MNKRVSRSLSAQLFCGVLLSLLAAAVMFGLCAKVGSYVLEKTVYGKPIVDQMADQQFAQLQRYVEQEDIGRRNLHRLNAWCSRGEQVYLTVYLDGEILYESPRSGAELETELEVEDFVIEAEDPQRAYTLTLSDGNVTQAFLYYYAGDAFFYWVMGLSGLAAFLLFSLCFISFVHRKLRYVQKLKEELDILAGGDLCHPVTVKGEDELGELAGGIDQMRRSILAHQAAESQMRCANSQLVTAMSHDLRTPLTALLAYLELMERGKYDGAEQLRHFIHRSLDKTMQIKSMADKLFEYFLVYSSEWEEPELERVDADGLIQQFWGEYIFSLKSKGFSVQAELGPLKGSLLANTGLLRRAFDNLYANLLKYAAPEQPVEILCRREGAQLQLSLTNHISGQRDEKESTNIGLNTCQRILQHHGGSFSAQEEAGQFCVLLTLPLVQ